MFQGPIQLDMTGPYYPHRGVAQNIEFFKLLCTKYMASYVRRFWHLMKTTASFAYSYVTGHGSMFMWLTFAKLQSVIRRVLSSFRYNLHQSFHCFVNTKISISFIHKIKLKLFRNSPLRGLSNHGSLNLSWLIFSTLYCYYSPCPSLQPVNHHIYTQVILHIAPCTNFETFYSRGPSIINLKSHLELKLTFVMYSNWASRMISSAYAQCSAISIHLASSHVISIAGSGTLLTLVVATYGHRSRTSICGRRKQPFVNRVCMKFEYITKVPYPEIEPAGWWKLITKIKWIDFKIDFLA